MSATVNTIKLSVYRTGISVALMSVVAQGAIAGEQWETKSTITSAKFGKMDLGTRKECRADGWRNNPKFNIAGDESCDARIVGKKDGGDHWKFVCGKSSGEGVIRTVGTDRIDSTIDMVTPDGQFTLRMEAKKLGGC